MRIVSIVTIDGVEHESTSDSPTPEDEAAIDAAVRSVVDGALLFAHTTGAPLEAMTVTVDRDFVPV